MIMEWPQARIVDAEDESTADVCITDGTVRSAPDVPVIMLTDGSVVSEALRAGAVAVLSDLVYGEQLHAAVWAARQGLTTLSSRFRDQLVEDSRTADALEEEAHVEPEPAAIELTARELQVLHLLAQGASNKMIARHLDITPHTAKFHVASIVAKLGATGRTDAVAKAMRMGVVMI